MMNLHPKPGSHDAVPLPCMLHATGVVIGETGVLIRGASGAGKSALARALIDEARVRGLHGGLIGDDRVRLKSASGRLIAAPHPEIAGKIEVRGRGILDVGNIAAAVVRIDVVLVKSRDELPRIPEKASTISWFGEIEILRLQADATRSSSDLAREIIDVCSTAWKP